MQVEAEELKTYGDQLGPRIVELDKEIYDLAGEEFNINSPKQLGVILFEKLGMPHAKKTKTGYSTAADVLDKLAPDTRSWQRYWSTAAHKAKVHVRGRAGGLYRYGRGHTRESSQTVTATGRLSSTEPNLQNSLCGMDSAA